MNNLLKRFITYSLCWAVLWLSIVSVQSQTVVWEEEPVNSLRFQEIKSTAVSLWQFWKKTEISVFKIKGQENDFCILKNYPLVCLNIVVPPPDNLSSTLYQ